MSDGKFFAGVGVGLIALLVEMAFFGGSFIIDLIKGTFPESAANLSSMLSGATTVNFIVNFAVGVIGAFGWRSMREFAVGFLVGVLSVLALFGGILNLVAPQIVDGLWNEFLAVFIPLFIYSILLLARRILQERQEYTAQW